MQCWNGREEGWAFMDEGKARAPWRPRDSALEAVVKCLAWTGLLCIPAMQVVDSAGQVVWRGLMDPFEFKGEWHFTDPEAGPPIKFEHEALARRMARQSLREPVRESVRKDDQAELF